MIASSSRYDAQAVVYDWPALQEVLGDANQTSICVLICQPAGEGGPAFDVAATAYIADGIQSVKVMPAGGLGPCAHRVELVAHYNGQFFSGRAKLHLERLTMTMQPARDGSASGARRHVSAAAPGAAEWDGVIGASFFLALVICAIALLWSWPLSASKDTSSRRRTNTDSVRRRASTRRQASGSNAAAPAMGS